MTRVLAAIAVAAIVVLAGCSGAPVTEAPGTDAGDGGTDTTTTADEEFVSVPSELVPPGANSRQITQPRALLQAHQRALSDANHSSNLTFSKIYLQQQYDAEGDNSFDVTHEEDVYTATERAVENGTVSTTDVYRGTEDVYIREDEDGNASYQYVTGAHPVRLQQYKEPRSRMISLVNVYTTFGTPLKPTGFANGDGRKLVKYETDGVGVSNVSQTRIGQFIAPQNSTVDDLSLTIYVDSRGVIHRAEGSMELTHPDGEERSRSLSYRLDTTDVSSPSEPSWTSEVAKLNGTLYQDNELLRVDNVGNVTVTDYSASVFSSQRAVAFGQPTAETSVNGSLEPGESAYVYMTKDGNETTLHVSETRPDVPSDAQALPKEGRAFVSVEASTQTPMFAVFKNTSDGSANATRPMRVASSASTLTELASLTTDEPQMARSD